MNFFRKIFIFVAVIPATFFANNLEQNDFRTRYNLTTQEPYLCQLAAVSHLPVEERDAIGRELIQLHQEQGLSCVMNVNVLNKDGKSAYDIAKEKYNETRSNYCLMFIDTLTRLEKIVDEVNKKIEDEKHQNREFIITLALWGTLGFVIGSIIKRMIS